MNTLYFLRCCVLGLVVAGPLAGTTFAKDSKRPNVVYIFTDDQSVRTLGCYADDAYPWVKTPNIDSLARKGVRFQNVYMAPFCVPSRITMMTGNLPHSARGTFQGEELKGDALKREIAEHPFWPQRLRETGYHTGMIGKWHIYPRPPVVGVDWDQATYWTKQMVNQYYYGQKMSHNGDEPVDLSGYSVDRHTDLAIDYIRERSAETKPWFLWLCYSGVHMPTQPAKRHEGSLASITDIPEPQSARQREGKPAYIQDIEPRDWSRAQPAVRRYHECVMAIDENVGRLMKVLTESGQLENTIVIFASDQGIAYGQHGLVHKKNAPYDAALRGPLIFSWPGHFAENAVCTQPVSGPDVTRTLLDLFALEPLPTMDGLTLLPQLSDPQKKMERDAMLMTNVQTSMGQRIPQGVARTEKFIKQGGKGEDAMPDWAMIRSGDFKYIAYVGEARTEEVYNLAEDPEELVNLAAKSDHVEVLARLRREAASELRRTQSGFDGGHFIDFFPTLRDLKS